jgi:hypothetical protein
MPCLASGGKDQANDLDLPTSFFLSSSLLRFLSSAFLLSSFFLHLIHFFPSRVLAFLAANCGLFCIIHHSVTVGVHRFTKITGCFFLLSYLLTLPGRAFGYPPAPPQTRTCAINASGSSYYGFAARYIE